jgi:hypothetical protein
MSVQNSECNVRQYFEDLCSYGNFRSNEYLAGSQNEPDMNKRSKLLLMMLAVVVSQIIPSCAPPAERDFYQLKIYRFDSATQEAGLDSYLEMAYLPALHRAGIENVGVFKLRENGNEMKNAIFLLIPFPTLESFDQIPGLLNEDPLYQDAGKQYINAPYDDPPYARIESILMKAFSGSPELRPPVLDSPRAERVYELRSYQSATEQLHELKVEMFNTGESALFRELGFQPVFFGDVVSGSQMPHLMYMSTFADTVSQAEHWSAFGEHPDWKKMREIDRFQNTVSHIDRYLLYPTGYSDY